MKNKKGFTLVEILAVIVLLALLIIFAVPAILEALEGGRTGIDKINKKNLTDACESVIVEVVSCKIHDETYGALGIHVSDTLKGKCDTLQDLVIGKTVTTNVRNLISSGYFRDDDHNCDLDKPIKITTNSSTLKVTVDLSEVSCRKKK